MPEGIEENESITQKLVSPTSPPTPEVSVVKTPANPVSQEEHRMDNPVEALQRETELPSMLSTPTAGYQKLVIPGESKRISKRDAAEAQMVQEQCRQLCHSVFFREHRPVHSLGFTSSIPGE